MLAKAPPSDDVTSLEAAVRDADTVALAQCQRVQHRPRLDGHRHLLRADHRDEFVGRRETGGTGVTAAAAMNVGLREAAHGKHVGTPAHAVIVHPAGAVGILDAVAKPSGEAARVTGMSERTIQRWIVAKRIVGRRVGPRVWQVELASLEKAA